MKSLNTEYAGETEKQMYLENNEHSVHRMCSEGTFIQVHAD